MEFCPTCGTLLQYELPASGRRQARFFCPTCPYVCLMESKVKIIKKQHLVKKGSEAIFNEDDKNKGKAETTEKCTNSNCDSTKAYFIQMQTRSADEASTIQYTCTKCQHVWAVNP